MKFEGNHADHDALLEIQELMDGVEWTPDTLESIALILENAGYRIHDTNVEEVCKPRRPL